MTEEKKKRISFEDQLRIVDRTSCEQAIRNGGVAALVVAGLTAIGAIAGFFVLWFVTAVRGTYLWHSKYRYEAAAPEVAS